jgi:hypothetical protein
MPFAILNGTLISLLTVRSQVRVQNLRILGARKIPLPGRMTNMGFKGGGPPTPNFTLATIDLQHQERQAEADSASGTT